MALSSWWRAEISRKVLHLSAAAIPLLYVAVDRQTMLGLLAVCVVGAIAIETLRHVSRPFQELFARTVGFMVRATEWGRLSGATYVLVAALLSVWLFPKRVAIAVLLILCVSDSAASLIGLRFGRGRFLGKSPAGSFAFFVTALAILWLVLPEDSLGIILVAAMVATCTEALPALRLGRFDLNDNLTVPLITGTVLWWLAAHTASTEIAAALLGH